MFKEEREEEKLQEVLRREIQEFLSKFEVSEEREEDMKTLLPLWRHKLLNHASDLGGGTKSQIQSLMNVCEDYANHRGMLERVRKEAEETRISLGM